jgi:hypothetical protein
MRSHAFLGLLFVAALGCSDSAPVAPDEYVTLDDLSPAEVAALQQLEEEELARIEARRSASTITLDSLKSYWGSLQKNWDSKGPLLICVPRSYDGGAKIIGPEGGEIELGAHRLTIPPGALERPVVITAEAPTALEVLLEFRPHGLKFKKRPVISFDYKHCVRPGWMNERVAYLGDKDEPLEWPEAHDREDGRVDAYIEHFSRYAVAF